MLPAGDAAGIQRALGGNACKLGAANNEGVV